MSTISYCFPLKDDPGAAESIATRHGGSLGGQVNSGVLA